MGFTNVSFWKLNFVLVLGDVKVKRIGIPYSQTTI